MPVEWITRIPQRFSTWQAMAIGTAGYPAGLSVVALQQHGLKPEDGPVVVTGAAGGLGSVASTLLAALGYEVHASTGLLRADVRRSGPLRDATVHVVPGGGHLALLTHLEELIPVLTVFLGDAATAAASGLSGDHNLSACFALLDVRHGFDRLVEAEGAVQNRAEGSVVV